MAPSSDEWQGAINKVREEITLMRERMIVVEHKNTECERRHDLADKRHDHLCETLNKTKDSIEAKIEKNSEDNKKQTDIIIEKIGLLMTDREVGIAVDEVQKENEQKAIGIIKYAPKFLVFLAAAAFTVGVIWATKQ